MYMIIALVLLGCLSLGLAYHWHQRITGFHAHVLAIKEQFNGDNARVSQERGYSHCISHKWVLDYMHQARESNIGNSIRDFINNRTVIGLLIMGVLICPITALLVVLFYRSFALLGASIAVLIIAVFLVRTSENVKSSHRLLSWLRRQDRSELREDDVVYAEVSLKVLTNWRAILIAVALLSMVAAPWGEIIPDAIAYATSSFLITAFSLIYPPVAAFSHRVAVIVILYAIPFAIALLYLLSKSLTRASVLVTEKIQDIRPAVVSENL